jgi:HD-GYP domain-containing protein (c-di-GMP phosphodiesterase class II)
MTEARRLRIRIVTVLVGALSAVAVVPMLLSHLRLIGINREALKTAEEQFILRSAVKLAGDVDHFYERAEIHLRKIADALALAATIAPERNPFTFTGQTALLADYVKSEPDFLVLQTLGRDGMGGAFRPPDRLDAAIVAELGRAYDVALKGEAFTGEPFRPPQFPDGGLVLAVPVFSQGREVLGVAEAFVSLARVKGWLEDEKKREVVAYIVDRRGNLVLASDPSALVPREQLPRVELVREFIAHPVRLTTSYSHGEGKTARRVLGTVAPVESLDWGVLVEKDEAKAYASVSQMTRTTSLGAAFALVLAVVVAFLGARALSKPVTELVEKVRLIADGNYKQRVPVRGARELAELSETFNSMSDAIEKSIEKLKQAARENQELFFSSIRALAAAIDAKDPYTRGHSERVARYSVVLARHMGLSPEEIKKVRISALLHDVGKIGIDDRILRKPTALTDEEFDVMKSHPVKGALIMGQIPQLKDVIPGMKYHHEKWTGGGYPDGLKGEEIPMLGRIISVADTFDAMTTTRPYQKAMQLDYVVSRIKSFSGNRFDPEVVTALEKAFAGKELEVVGEAARMAVPS